jgi:hypothetical protein
MLDQSLLQSHFIGRDGFRWWIGQIPPTTEKTSNGEVDVWDGQSNGNGWGNRRKVRILGYHPIDDKQLKNEDLPWAQVLIPTTSGTGSSNYAINPKLRPGDVVIGFFLDGDSAQIPVIMGALGNTSSYSKDLGYTFPFVPFTGYTSNIPSPKESGRNYPNQTNEETENAQPTPAAIPDDVAQRTGQITSAPGMIGYDVTFADTCGDTTIKTVKTEVNNLLKTLKDAQGKIDQYKQDIRKTAEVIKSSLNWLVGHIIDSIYNFLVGCEKKPGIIPKALQALYINVYGSTLAATGSPSAAHTAGYKSNEFFVIPIKVMEQAISCVANSIVEGLTDLIVELLESLLQNVKNFATCAAEQFIGSLTSTIVDSVADGLSSALDGISGLIGGVFNVVEFVTSTIDAIKGLSGFLDCNQTNAKCDGVKEWKTGIGPKKELNVDNAFENIYNIANNISGIVDSVKSVPDQLDQIVNSATGVVNVFAGDSLNDSLQNALDAAGTCFTGTPTSCGPPVLNIFGGGGIGGAAVPILGAAIQSTSIYNNVNETANIIGAVITNSGSGYRFPPFVEIVDSCGLGYGAKARATINDKGQINSIYITSSGTNYPRLVDQEPYGVTDVVVQTPGLNYSSGDTAYDNLGNSYTLTIDNGVILSAKPLNRVEATDIPVIRINSENGFGAVLKPVLGPLTQLGKIQTQVDCPT